MFALCTVTSNCSLMGPLVTDFTFTVNGPFIDLAVTMPLDETVAYFESELDIS